MNCLRISKSKISSYTAVSCNLFRKASDFLVAIVLSHIFSVAEVGQLNVINSWASIFLIFATFNFVSGFLNIAFVNKENRNKSLASITLLTSVIALIFMAIFCSNTFFCGLLKVNYFVLLSMCVGFVFQPVIDMYTAKERFDEKYISILIISIIYSAIIPLISISSLFIFNQKSVSFYFILNSTLRTILAIAIYIYIIFKYSSLKDKKFYLWKEAILFNIVLIPHFLSQIILSQSDRIMISYMVNDEAAGLYSACYTLSSLILVLVNSINMGFSPYMFKKLNENSENSEFKVIYEKILILLALIISLFQCFSYEIIRLVYKSEYYVGAEFINIIIGSVFFIAIYTYSSCIEMHYRKNYFIAISSIIAAILNIILNLIFINIYGYIAAAYTTLICYVLYAISHYIFSAFLSKKNSLNIMVVSIISVFVVLSSFITSFMCYNYVFKFIYGILITIIFVCLFFIFYRKRKIQV